MKHLLVVCLGLCGVFLSCGGATGVGGPPPPTTSDRFAYVSNVNSDALTAYKVNSSNGALTPIGGSPFGGVGSPMGLAISPNSELLAAGSVDGPGVSMFRVDKTTGSITSVTGSPFLTPGGGYPIRSVFHKSGKFLYSAMIPSTASNVWAFSVDASSGALSPVPGSPFAGQTLVGLGGTNSIALHPSGSYLYSSGPFMGITGYSIDTTSGALSQLSGSPFVPTGAFFNTELTVHPSGNFLYMADLDADGVRVFPIASDGSVGTEVAGSPFASGAAPRDLALNPSGKFVFVPNEGDLNVTTFAVNASTGALTLVGNADTGNGPSAVTVDSLGKFLYVTNYWDGKVSAYSIDSASGALAPVAGSPFAAQDGAISVVTTK